MVFDKVFSNNSCDLNSKNNQYDSILKDGENIKNLESDINKFNSINKTIEFLLKMNGSKLICELYGFLKKQIKTYSEISTYRVLELTKEQLSLFKQYSVSLEIFKESPFSIDSILVYEYDSIEYNYYNSSTELDKIISKNINSLSVKDGLYYLTSNVKGYLGNGMHVSNINDEESCYTFNNLIYDRLSLLSRTSDGYIYYVSGKYSGLIKKCIYGKLKGVYVICDNLTLTPVKQREELCLYGEIEVSDDIYTLDDDDVFNLKLQENLPGVKLSFVKDEIMEDAKG